MNFKPKKWQIITTIAFLSLLLLNPSLDRFTDFIGHSKFKMEGHNLVRKMNFLIFSVYDDQTLDDMGRVDTEDKYLGFLNNFIPLN